MYQVTLIRDTNSQSSDFRTKREAMNFAKKEAKGQCEEINVLGVHQHHIFIEKGDEDNGFNEDIGTIELPTHDDYYNHSDAHPYQENKKDVRFYQENLEIK